MSISVENSGMVNESVGAVAILVSLTGELDRDVTVRIETADGTGIYTQTFYKIKNFKAQL